YIDLESHVIVSQGDIYHHESLVKAIKQVDVVICALGSLEQIADQVKIVAAIKEAGNIKARHKSFLNFLIFFQLFFSSFAKGDPYTYLVSNGFAGYFLPNFGIALTVGTRSFTASPPRDKVEIIGDGNSKEDIATYTIEAVDDPRTLNKVLHIRSPANILSFNEIVSLWEKNIGKTLEKTYLLEDQLLKKIQESPSPLSLFLSIADSQYVSQIVLLVMKILKILVMRIIGAAEQEHDREPAAGLVVGHQLGSDVAAAARTDVSPQAAEAQGGDSRIERGGVAEGISQSANGNTEGEAVDGGGANGRDSSYQRYDIQQAARWIEQVLPFSLLLLVGLDTFGKYIVEESAKAGPPTFELVRENTASNPEKSKLIESFKSSGLTILHSCDRFTGRHISS
ncbi:isoflavone reductase-like protein, partial [Quercus suber]